VASVLFKSNLAFCSTTYFMHGLPTKILLSLFSVSRYLVISSLVEANSEAEIVYVVVAL